MIPPTLHGGQISGVRGCADLQVCCCCWRFGGLQLRSIQQLQQLHAQLRCHWMVGAQSTSDYSGDNTSLHAGPELCFQPARRKIDHQNKNISSEHPLRRRNGRQEETQSWA